MSGLRRAGDAAWGWLTRRVLLPAGDRLFRHPMTRRLAFLEEAQWWSRERLHARRDAELRALVRTAYDEVPFYRSLMDEAGIGPEEIRGAADLTRLPIVDKATFRAAPEESTIRDTGLRTYQVSSSGSTGTNFFVQEDSETAGRYRAAFLLALEWAGWKPGEPHMQTGMTLDRSGQRKLKDLLLRCHYVSAFGLRDADLDAALDRLEARSIDHLWGYPGSLYYLARRAAERGWSRRLRSAVTWGDNLFPHYRETIEKTFGTRLFDTYGCAEGIQVAAQCGHDGTYHLHTLDTVVEVVDDAGEPVRPGRPGHLILTRLHPGPMPLIRYRVGDIGVLGDRACPCGRGLDVLEEVQGRDTDVVITPSGNRLIVHFFTGLLEQYPEVEHFQVLQPEAERLVLRVVPGSGFSDATADDIVGRLQEHGADLSIRVEPVEELPPTPSGKRRFVISEHARALREGRAAALL